MKGKIIAVTIIIYIIAVLISGIMSLCGNQTADTVFDILMLTSCFAIVFGFFGIAGYAVFGGFE